MKLNYLHFDHFGQKLELGREYVYAHLVGNKVSFSRVHVVGTTKKMARVAMDGSGDIAVTPNRLFPVPTEGIGE